MTPSPRPSAYRTKRQSALQPQPPGCIAWPARVLAVLVVVPLRLLWEVLAAVCGLLYAYVLRPIGWLFTTLIITPLRLLWLGLVVYPVRWLYRAVLSPVGRWLYRAVLSPLGRWLYDYALVPLGRVLRWIGIGLMLVIVTPIAFVVEWAGKAVLAIYNFIRPALAAFGQVAVDALSFAWRIAGHVARFLGLVLFHLVVRPVRRLWDMLVSPVLSAVWWVWSTLVVSPVRWVTVSVMSPIGAAARSVLRAMGVGGP